MSGQDFILKIPTQSTNLKIIRDFITDIADKAGFDEDKCCDIALAVDEACTNVIKHAYRGGDDKEIIVKVKYDEKEITITISDTGKGFDKAKVGDVNLEEYLTKMTRGGLGIHLMRKSMDEVEFNSDDKSINSVRMVKYLT